jgi:hypothetical protein
MPINDLFLLGVTADDYASVDRYSFEYFFYRIGLFFVQLYYQLPVVWKNIVTFINF